ncbi:rhodanese-like domain-containing protein [Nitrosophilus alvini]|uniref:rhodanese-like domain-containing protein n=1 Tax=Nitrosophilus alvini TaxID=2714855 RepID=UPI00190E3621|nr:rhodanese-like domain-containing protein [Nitrosophilus alvini]
MRFFIAFAMFISLLFAEENVYYEDDITPKEAYFMQQNGAILIDVRTPAEFLYGGHAPGSINIPIFFYHIKPKDIKYRIKFSQMELKKNSVFDAHKMYDINPVENENFAQNVKAVVKKYPGKALLIICRSGQRSAYAANLLAKKGYDEVYNVSEGFTFGWKKAGLPWGAE